MTADEVGFVDPTMLRSARSLWFNRLLRRQVRSRLERAEFALRGAMLREGVTELHTGLFTLRMLDDELIIDKRSVNGAEQLELPDVEGGEPGETLEALIARAAGDDGLPLSFLEALEEFRELVLVTDGAGS